MEVLRGKGVGIVLAVLAALASFPAQIANVASGPEPELPPAINVRWATGVSTEERTVAERLYRLSNGSPGDRRNWTYLLGDTSRANISALVRDARVEDTHGAGVLVPAANPGAT